MTQKESSLTDLAYKMLKEKIQNCVYMPGEPLSEKGICNEIGSGRTPVREALLALRAEGLIDIFPRKGIRVAQFTRKSIGEIYQMRKLLEPTVCKKYYLRLDKSRLLEFDEQFYQIDRSDDRLYYTLDTAFHMYLIQAADNQMLNTFFAGLMEVQYRFGIYSTKIGTADKHDYYTEHHEIIEALLAEDTTRIEKTIVDHTNHSEVIALKTLRVEHIS